MPVPECLAWTGILAMEQEGKDAAPFAQCCRASATLLSLSVWMMTTDQELIDAWQRLCTEMMVRCGFIDVTICPLQSEVHTNILSSAASETMPQITSMEDPLSPVPPRQHAYTLRGRNVKCPLPS